MATFRENLLTRRDNIALELAATRNTDTNEYVLRLWEELRRLDELLASNVLDADGEGAPFEKETRGIT